MTGSQLIRALLLTAFTVSGIAACGQAQQNLANPVVKGDRSTIQGDAKATALQKTGTE